MNKLAVLGPNPAWQKTLFFQSFTKGAVNRARRMDELASGKGINFCRALSCAKKSSFTLIQFSGGDNGAKLDAALKSSGMEFISVKVSGPTRCCTTCLDEKAQMMTEIIEPSFPASAAEVDAMLGSFEEVLKEVSGAAFCGSLPDGTDPALYIRAAKLAGAYKVPLLIDARRDLDEVFAAGAEIILKINREELAELSGLQDPLEGLRSLFSRFANLKYAAITDGPGKAFAADGSQIAFYTLPELKFIASPLGCGDTASAILLSEICSGKDIFTAFRYALAAASANCLNPTPGKFDPAEAEKLLPDLEYSVL
ncbi:MAG: hypothetical protein IKA87_09930 [Lentisphaeria bacterium]|nr:hypothetical protein [Lentisphaeria bacterium]